MPPTRPHRSSGTAAGLRVPDPSPRGREPGVRLPFFATGWPRRSALGPRHTTAPMSAWARLPVQNGGTSCIYPGTTSRGRKRDRLTGSDPPAWPASPHPGRDEAVTSDSLEDFRSGSFFRCALCRHPVVTEKNAVVMTIKFFFTLRLIFVAGSKEIPESHSGMRKLIARAVL